MGESRFVELMDLVNSGGGEAKDSHQQEIGLTTRETNDCLHFYSVSKVQTRSEVLYW